MSRPTRHRSLATVAACAAHALLGLGIATIVSTVAAPPAHAQDYPARPITMVIPFPVGGSTDVLGRMLAASMSRSLQQQVVVENTGGAGGTVGAARVARARADGYTVLFHNMAHATAPALYRTLPYDPAGAFEPVGLVADVPMILVARKNFPARDFKELQAYARTSPDKINFANAGIGATSHLCGMLLMSAMQTDLTTVPFKGTGPALNDLIGGQVDLLCDQPASTAGHIAAGAIRALAVAHRTRLPSLPDVPTFDESGLKGFELSVWHGLYAPKGTPRAAVDRLAQALREALRDPPLVQRFNTLGAQPVDAERATPEALRAHLRADLDKWAPVIKRAGVYAD
ncbi:MAG TPA: tripartite tricarboxylate transporter substrate-binding protein [Quisquiliibacterium sp.]|nr:tripartite tricarboxylate transporter substrate-binding protein [Quisquiliibacterium sp.]